MRLATRITPGYEKVGQEAGGVKFSVEMGCYR